MGVRETYDSIIEKIEADALDFHSYPKAEDVVPGVLCHGVMSLPDMNAVVRFMTGRTLLNYIKERKLMASYSYLITAKKPVIGNAAEIAGYDNQQSFTKKFTPFFGFPPGDAIKEKDETLYVGPAKWNVISCDTLGIEAADESGDSVMAEQRVFGIRQADYEKAIEAHNLEVLYDFSPIFSKVAFEIHESLGVSLKEAFSYLDSLREFGGDFTDDDPDDEDTRTPEEWLRSMANDPFYQFIYFRLHLSPDWAYELPTILAQSEEKIMQLAPDLLRAFAHIRLTREIVFSYFKQAYEFYFQHTDKSYDEDNYEEYMDSICVGIPKEKAFAALIPNGIFDDFDMDIADDPMIDLKTLFEREAEEEDKWRNVRIDIEPDEDNPGYCKRQTAIEIPRGVPRGQLIDSFVPCNSVEPHPGGVWQPSPHGHRR